jgi:hypothetical protein
VSTAKRRKRIIGLTELDGPGLEIAPLYRPIMLKSDWDVTYVDIVSTDQLKAHYADDPGVRSESIVDVDVALTDSDGTIRPLSEAARGRSPFSWVVASHVIEHVPDLITWLDDIATLLRDGGALVLVIPDTRYTFDVHRPHTTVGQMLQAHHQQDLIPSVRAVYDYLRSASTIRAADAWAGQAPSLSDSRIHDLPYVLDQLDKARHDQYVDSHVWTFRPSTFIEQINELGRMGLCQFVVETVRNTRPNELEFFAVLRRLPRDRSPELDARLRSAGKQTTNDDPSRYATTSQQPAAGLQLSPREEALVRRKRAVVRAARRALRRS